jgi:hypothetical protein
MRRKQRNTMRKSAIKISLLTLLIAGLVLQACGQAPARFTVLSFNVKPEEIIAGEATTIKATVASSAEKEEICDVALMVNGVAQDREIVTIPAGETRDVTFSLVQRKAGSYKVAIGDKSATLVVRDVPPPDFRILEFKIEPEQVDIGEKVVITAKVKNSGGSKGSYVAQLRINDVQKEAQTVNLEPGKDILVIFVRNDDEPGTYTVTLGTATGKYVVTEVVWPAQTTNQQCQPQPGSKSRWCPGGS